MTDGNHMRPIGDGWMGIGTVDLTTVIDMKYENEAVYLTVEDPEQLRYLAARLLVEAMNLQDRIDIHNGEGGDQ